MQNTAYVRMVNKFCSWHFLMQINKQNKDTTKRKNTYTFDRPGHLFFTQKSKAGLTQTKLWAKNTKYIIILYTYSSIINEMKVNFQKS